MLFSSITFLYAFLPIVLLIYYAVPIRLKNFVLLISSLVVYFFGEPKYTLLLLISSLSAFLHGLLIECRSGTKVAKIALTSALTIDIALLGFFKYSDFIIINLNSVLGTHIPLTNVSLPIGISFFTFQTMSYTIDVYRRKVKCSRNIATFATFVSLFPQLVAGPIVRYADVDEELRSRTIRLDGIALGIRRFTYGLGKKVLIANAMGQLCTIFRDSSEQTVLFFWLYAIAFTLQIYFDFSGYSDMAIGLGQMFGFKFPENFNYPYMSRSLTEFWRRWHMSMGGWFRDYVYIPMGGNRVTTVKWLRNILVVWFLTGLWHGASWNFIVWGLMFGVILLAEKLFLNKLVSKAGQVVSHFYVMFIVIISFVIFNANGLGGALNDLSGMFGLAGIPLIRTEDVYQLKSYAIILAIAIFGATSVTKTAVVKLVATPIGAKVAIVLEPISVALILITVTAFLVDGSFNPFLYFRF